jgi:hypothetical protein
VDWLNRLLRVEVGIVERNPFYEQLNRLLEGYGFDKTSALPPGTAALWSRSQLSNFLRRSAQITSATGYPFLVIIERHFYPLSRC